jgi:asparagine synthase (glutamine-hydrolysing)
MCGIAGIWNVYQPVDAEVFDMVVNSLGHRGPDGRGVKRLDEGRLYMGHCRLSIIDLSDAGNQPMSNEDGAIWLTFNGEIYNYAYLRRKLEGYGHKFYSRTDSETIIHAYEEWGTACVHRFRGIFAFAIYDCRQKSLFLARDHIGIKPLYYYQDKNSFIFASQPRSILASGRFNVKVDYSAFILYLSYGNVPGDASIYEGISKLLPGHWLLLKDGKVNIQQYWKLTYAPTIHDAREAEDVVHTKIEECVRAQTVSDVPIGTLLSGGVDSTIITSILARDYGKELSSYTIGFEEEESDERRYASFTAKTLQTQHHERVLTYIDACRLLPKIIEAYDEPFHLNGLFPFLALSRLVKSSGLKVVLGGDGGDELFAGYLWYEHFNNSQKIKGNRTFSQRLSSLFGLNAIEKESELIKIFFQYNGFLDNNTLKDILEEEIKIKPDCYRPLKNHWRSDLPLVLAGQFLDFSCFLVDHCLELK